MKQINHKSNWFHLWISMVVHWIKTAMHYFTIRIGGFTIIWQLPHNTRLLPTSAQVWLFLKPRWFCSQVHTKLCTRPFFGVLKNGLPPKSPNCLQLDRLESQTELFFEGNWGISNLYRTSLLSLAHSATSESIIGRAVASRLMVFIITSTIAGASGQIMRLLANSGRFSK